MSSSITHELMCHKCKRTETDDLVHSKTLSAVHHFKTIGQIDLQTSFSMSENRGPCYLLVQKKGDAVLFVWYPPCYLHVQKESDDIFFLW